MSRPSLPRRRSGVPVPRATPGGIAAARTTRLAVAPALAALAAAGCADAPTAGVTPSEPVPSASVTAGDAERQGERIPGQYIVVFRDDVRDVPGLARQLAAAHGGTLRFTYQHALRGFAAALPEAAAQALTRNPNVRYVEEDRVVSVTATTQPNATWGLDRIDQRNLPLSKTFSYTATGAGVRVYILDTGINLGHTEFGGRAFAGYDAITPSTGAADCQGHGTHVAGTAGGATYGVAKRAELVSVRVLGCDGNGANSGVIAGIDWITEDVVARRGPDGSTVVPAVVNVSLMDAASDALDGAVSRSIAERITYAIAAGNGLFFGGNACNYSPGRVPEAITVSATDSRDTRGSYAHYGRCVDLFAPGSSITSAAHNSTSGTAVKTGTSMAAPHVAGVAALYLERNAGATPAQVHKALVDSATTGKVKSAGSGSPNRLLFTSY